MPAGPQEPCSRAGLSQQSPESGEARQASLWSSVVRQLLSGDRRASGSTLPLVLRRESEAAEHKRVSGVWFCFVLFVTVGTA